MTRPRLHPNRRLRRLAACALVLAASGAAVACGEDGTDSLATGGRGDAGTFITLAEARGVIEQAVAIVRTGGSADVGGVAGDPDLEQTVVDSGRYATQSGREFDVFVFGSQAAARSAAPSVVDNDDGESAIRAANVLAVFPTRYQSVDAYSAVAGAMRRLAVACNSGDERGEPQLRWLCVTRAGIPPQGEGVDRDEAQEQGEPVVVGGLHYDPRLARRLNPNIAPDKAMLSGRRPPAGKVWFGAFLRVCNRGERERMSSDRLALVDAFGARARPSDALARDNLFAYRPMSLKPGECLPRPGSVAERTNGALVLFAVKPELLQDRPVALEVDDERVVLDA